MSAGAIRGTGLEKRFGGVHALRGVDLEVAPGESLAVLGANGAGKTTLLKILAGVQQPSRGSLEIGGLHHSATNREGLRSQVGYVGHASLLYPELTARENLLFVARLYGVPDPAARVARLLDEAGLAEVSERRVATFSRGMAQRLSIVRALCHDPSVVLLDEPFSGLDRGAADRLTTRLAALRAEGRTLVVVTHDLHQACSLASRALVLAGGRVHHREAGPRLEPAALERACANADASLGNAG